MSAVGETSLPLMETGVRRCGVSSSCVAGKVEVARSAVSEDDVPQLGACKRGAPFLLANPFDQVHTSLMMSGYRIGDPRALVALRVFLRLTAMDVCCGPPSYR
jgi:hypothetical protein